MCVCVCVNQRATIESVGPNHRGILPYHQLGPFFQATYNYPHELLPCRAIYILIQCHRDSCKVKPEKVLFVGNAAKDVLMEFMKDIDSIHLCEAIEEALVHLTLLDNQDSENIMTEKQHNYENATEWS